MHARASALARYREVLDTCRSALARGHPLTAMAQRAVASLD